MAKKRVVIITIVSFAVSLYGMERSSEKSMERSSDKKIGVPRFSLPLEKDTLSKSNSGKLVSTKNGKRSIRSLSDVAHLKSSQGEYRDRNVSPNRRNESSEKK